MQKLFRNLSDTIEDLFTQAAKIAFDVDDKMEITQTNREEFGAYQCNSALKLAKTLSMPPRQVAEKLIAHLKDNSSIIKKCDIAGPGFINVHLNKSILESDLTFIANNERLGVPTPDKKKRIVCEFSSPNVAKAMHVGHLRSTIIGDSIARLLEFLGHDVVRLNHIGNWGTQFGMLITYLKHFKPEAIEDASGETLEQLMVWYKAAKVQFDENPAFKKESQEEVVRLQSGDPVATKSLESNL